MAAVSHDQTQFTSSSNRSTLSCSHPQRRPKRPQRAASGTLSARGSLGVEHTERAPTQPFSSSSKSRSSDTEGSFEGVNIQNLEMTLVLK